jgi:acyl dehydratase
MTAPHADEVLLPGVPRLGGLYRRGLVAGAGRFASVRRRHAEGPADVPAVRYAVRGVRVDAERLTAYQHLVGEPALDALPAGFVHVVAFPVAVALMVRDDFPLPLLGMVHLANRVTQRAALSADDELDVLAWARDLREHRSGTAVDLVAQVRRAGDDEPPAWEGVSTYLAKGVRLVVPDDDDRAGSVTQGATNHARSGGADGAAPEREAFVPPVPTGVWHLGADTGRRYAAVSGDVNPIHLSAASARPFGFRRAIAHGMFTAARALADVGAARGEAFTWDVEFASPVLLPSGVAVRTARDEAGAWTTTAWRPGTDRRHLTSTVTPG